MKIEIFNIKEKLDETELIEFFVSVLKKDLVKIDSNTKKENDDIHYELNKNKTYKFSIEIYIPDNSLFNRYQMGLKLAIRFNTNVAVFPPFSYENQFEWCLITPDGKFYGAYEDDTLNADDNEVEDFGISDHLVAIEFDLNED